jgi:hypothetical protein
VILFSKMFGIFGRVAVVFEGIYVLLEPYCEISAGLSHICLLAVGVREFVYA